MDLEKLKSEHPSVYAAVLALGVTAGVDQERDRVGAHLTMGASSGDMKTAIEAIEKGDNMTATLQAKYMAAGMNRANVQARGDDDGDAGSVADGANNDDDKGEDAKKAAVSNIFNQAAESCGVELEA